MTNIEIAQILLKEAKKGKLDKSILPHFMNSLEHGGPVPDPKDWLFGIANSLPDLLIADKCREQLRDLAMRWDKIPRPKTGRVSSKGSQNKVEKKDRAPKTIDELVKKLNCDGQGWSQFEIVRKKGGWIAQISPGDVRTKAGEEVESSYGQRACASPKEAAEQLIKTIRGHTIRINPCGMWQSGSPVIDIPEDLELGFRL